MEILKSNYSGFSLINPLTKELVLDEQEFNEAAESLIAYWHSDCFEMPFIKNNPLKASWDKYIKRSKHEINPYSYEGVINFLLNYKDISWRVFEITFRGMACGPYWYTVIFVVHKNVVAENIEEVAFIKITKGDVL